MASEERWLWEFRAYQAMDASRPVQDWLDDLSVEEREEIADLLAHYQVVTDRQWRRPGFDPLPGAGGISEIRCDIKTDEGMKHHRMYGYFGPEEKQYTILHAHAKNVRNDRDGKQLAKQRMDEIEERRGETHKLDFEGESDETTRKGPGSAR